MPSISVRQRERRTGERRAVGSCDHGERRDDRAGGGGCRLTDAEQQYRKHVLAATCHRRAERRGGDGFARLVPDRAQRLS